MKNFLNTKKIIVSIVLINSFSVAFLYVTFKTGCFSDACDAVVRDGLVVPLFWSGIFILPIMSFFLFFPEAIFKMWFKRIAWWYFSILFILTISTPIYSSNILALGRSQLVLGGMILLALITIPFVFIMKKRMV